MKLRFSFAFVVIYITAVLLFTVYLRSTDDRIVYKLTQCKARQSRLKQQLANKQLRVESLMNPASLSQHLAEEN